MITVGKYKIFFGDFHGQWNSSKEELALLPAGLDYYGYDFTVFQTPSLFAELKNILNNNNINIIPFKGLECMYEWGHLTTANITGDPPAKDNPDWEKVLNWFRSHTDWTVMAHPYPFMIDKLENLVVKNLLDAVELINGFADTDRHLIKWYYDLLQNKKKIPIVSGLDIHIATGSRRPTVLYSSAYKPEDDITLFNSNRTGVICEECTKDAIKKAIQTFHTFIEIPRERVLIGPPEITEYLEKQDYWKIVCGDLEQRRTLIPETEHLAVAGQRSTLSWKSKPDKIVIDGKTKTCESRKTNIPVPDKYDRNTYYINIVSEKDTVKTVNALKVYNPLNVTVYSDLEGNVARTVMNIANITGKDLRDIDVKISNGSQDFTKEISVIKVNMSIDVINSWELSDYDRPHLFEIQITTLDYAKNIKKYLVFTECRYIEHVDNDKLWDSLPVIKMTGNYKEQIDHSYTVYWNGDNDLSAEIRMAWNNKGLYFKISVIDDFLVQSKTDLLMFGDCFQIGLNPVGTEAVGNQSFYDIMMTRGSEPDDEKAYMERPVNMALEYPVSKRILLDGLYHTKATGNKFEGLLTLPFNMINPMIPVVGYRFGLYLVIFDNDGNGLKTSLQWPLAAEQYVKQAWYIPYGGAWATIKLTD